MVKFTIAIPVYNVRPYLKECLDSIVNQSYGEWEMICVDDGSTDGSAQLLDDYARGDKRIRVVHQPNQGVSAARNVAIGRATGDWIWFVDADDGIASGSLHLLSDILGGQKYSVLHTVSFRSKSWQEGDEAARDASSCNSWYDVRACSYIASTFFGSACMRIFRREAIGTLRFPAYRYNEDAIFVMAYCAQGRGWLDIDVPLYRYRARTGSATHRKLTKETVGGIFESENVLLDHAIRLGKLLPEAELGRLFARLFDRNFLTYEGAYFKLAPLERKELLPVWLAIQDRFSGLCRVSAKKKVCLWLARHFPSGYVVKFLVVGLGRINKVFHGLRVFHA